MFFPLGDDQVQGGHRAFVAYGFLALNVLLFLYQVALPVDQINVFVNEYGAIPAEIQRGDDWFSLFTSMFLHGGWLHLLGNMLYLYIFADNIEATIGSTAFLVFYLLGGLAAHAAHIYSDPLSDIPTVGASGALSAVMGAYLVLFPRARINGLLLFFRVSIPAILFLLFWFFQQSMSGYASLTETSMAEGGGIAWWAHIGGFVFGVAAGFFFKTRYHIPTAESGFRARRESDRYL